MVIAVSPLAERLNQARLSRRLTLEQVAEALTLPTQPFGGMKLDNEPRQAQCFSRWRTCMPNRWSGFSPPRYQNPPPTPDLEADRELLMNEVDLAFRAVSNELSDEAIRSIADYIRFVHEREERW